MSDQFFRTQLLIGVEGLERLAACRVAVFGIGGVGGYAVEALVRSGIGAIDLVDDDKICLTNLNRQLIATHKTVGKFKADVAAERINEINPDCKVTVHKTFFLPENKAEFPFPDYDYIIDAVDTVTAKLALAETARDMGVPLISCMGTGNKLDPTMLEVADISKTSVCPLARVMRRELKKHGIAHLKVVYSREPPIKPAIGSETGCPVGCITSPDVEKCSTKRVPGSTAFVPAAAGLILAAEVVKDLLRGGKEINDIYSTNIR